MKNQNDRLNKFETISTIIVNVGTILSWIITFVTALTLISQPQPIVIPGVFELGNVYIVIFLICVLLGYIQLLRQFWSRSRMTNSDTESNFSSYLYTSIVKFRRPFVLIGFVIFLVAIFQVEPAEFGVILTLAFIVCGAVAYSIKLHSPITLKKILLEPRR